MLPLTPGSQFAQSARRESNPRLALIRSLPSPLSYRPRASRAGGSRTRTLPLKRRIRCHYATAPNETRTYGFQRVATHHVSSPQVVRGGIAPATGDVSDRHASVTPPDQAVARSGVEPLFPA